MASRTQTRPPTRQDRAPAEEAGKDQARRPGGASGGMLAGRYGELLGGPLLVAVGGAVATGIIWHASLTFPHD